MRKFIIYTLFALSSLFVTGVFVTSDTYYQLGIAMVLYPLLVFFAYKVFLNKRQNVAVAVTQVPMSKRGSDIPEEAEVEKEGGGISDFDKRDFLKMIGAAGVSFFLFSLFNRRSEPLFFGKTNGPGTTTLEDSSGRKINPAVCQPTDSYVISEIDESFASYYGFTNTNGGWYIMRIDPDDGSIRYIKGDDNFSGNWTGRENLNYDYYHKVFN